MDERCSTGPPIFAHRHRRRLPDKVLHAYRAPELARRSLLQLKKKNGFPIGCEKNKTRESPAGRQANFCALLPPCAMSGPKQRWNRLSASARRSRDKATSAINKLLLQWSMAIQESSRGFSGASRQALNVMGKAGRVVPVCHYSLLFFGVPPVFPLSLQPPSRRHHCLAQLPPAAC